jgi:SAM-dependent methyltransferase
VINVEASHAYPRLPRFLAEVARVLRPGGHFLYADFRGRSEFPWEAALAGTPMRQVSPRVINASVLRSLDKNSQRSLELIGGKRPAFMWPRPQIRRRARHRAAPVIQNGKAEYRM